MPQLLASIQALKAGATVDLKGAKDKIFKEITPYSEKIKRLAEDQIRPFTPMFLKRYPVGEKARVIIHEFIAGNKNAGNTLSAILELDTLEDSEKRVALALLPLCFDNTNKNGLVSVLKTTHLCG